MSAIGPATVAMPGPLRDFVAAMQALLRSDPDEPRLLAGARVHLARLIVRDDWLPAACARPLPDRYAQYPLHIDAQRRFSVVSFVWGPGQRTPVHDHCTWGLVGMLRGAEWCDEYHLSPDHEAGGAPAGIPMRSGHRHLLRPGQIDAVSPTLGDWHQVANALSDAPSISIHVYGGDIGAQRRHRLDEQGRVCEFVSGYTAIEADGAAPAGAPR